MVRIRFMTLNEPVEVHGAKTTVAALHRAGLIRIRKEYVATRRGYQWQYFADYLPDCDDARGIAEGWRIAYATYQALLRRTESEVPVSRTPSPLPASIGTGSAGSMEVSLFR
ncbi:hypothetical protein [Sulfobacillus harzensis]|uniref:Uncharacterized protein n=1 Tax=Sulfobacillus harzensis TaxID=2729629 RepID=A0A7Y0Q203_9FIRM|nr:hypothetical protein [Sulfobacillus harzensis]NMP22653.1 hypothetical protein [Sulfobacillus harzensis]